MSADNLLEGLAEVLNNKLQTRNNQDFYFLDLLKQQVDEFENVTQGKLIGKIVGVGYEDDEHRRYDIDLVAPELDGYSFTLFSVEKGRKDFPLFVEYGLEHKRVECNSPEELRAAIRRVIFSDEAVESMVSTIKLIDYEAQHFDDEQNE